MGIFFSGNTRRMVLLVVFLSVMPPLGILLHSGMQSYRDAQAVMQRHCLRTVEGLAGRPRVLMENSLAVLSAISRVSALKDFSEAFSDEVFRNMLQEYPLYNNSFILYGDGRVMHSGLPGHSGRDLSREPIFASARRSAGVTILPVERSPFTGDWVMQIVLPLLNRQGRVYAYLGTELRLLFFDSVFAGQPIPPGGKAFLLDSGGRLAIGSTPDSLGKRGEPVDSRLWEVLEDQLGDTGTVRYQGGDGEWQFAAFRRLRLDSSAPPYLTAVLVVPQSAEDVQPAALLRRDMVLLGAAALAALLVGLLLCHRGFVLPVRVLLGAAKRLGGGDLQARVVKHPYLQGEFAELNDEFNAMANVLEARSAELEEAREAAVRSSIAKSEFLANMSHEIRTPMNAILGMTHLVGKTGLAESQRSQVAKIYEAAEDLLRLLNNILDFSKLEAGKMRAEHIAFHLGRLLNAVRDAVAEKAAAGKVRLVSSIPAGIPAAFVGDPARLARALSLLLEEAMRHARGRPVELSCRVEDNDDSSVRMHFTKTVRGVSLAPETVDRMRSNLEARTPGAASLDNADLGLMLAGSILHLLGGAASVERLEDGLRLTGSLRLDLPEETAFGQSLRFQGDRVLLLGGGETARSGLRRLLERSNLRVEECVDPAGGPALVRQAEAAAEPISLVVAEYVPGDAEIGGVISRIKQERRAPRLVLTGQGEAPPPELFAAGADSFLPRPINESLLIDALAGLIGQSAAEGARAAVEQAGEAGAHFEGLRALLVDDNAVNREIAREILQGAGLEVDAAVDGQQAVDMCRAAPDRYDMVFMDLEMPGLNGLEATQVLRGQEAFSFWRLPVIAMTAHSGAEEVAACLDAGMNDYTLKPISPRDLFRVIRRWLPLAQENREKTLTLMRQAAGILERVHIRDPELEMPLKNLAPLLHEGRMDALRVFLERQDTRALAAVFDDYLGLPEQEPARDR